MSTVSTSNGLKPGFAAIKREYLVEQKEKTLLLDHISAGDKRSLDEDGSIDGAKKLKGQNKSRRNFNKNNNVSKGNVCRRFVSRGDDGKDGCTRGAECRFSHDIVGHFADNPRPEDIGDTCYLYQKYGYCSYGALCRFGSSHIDGATYENLIDNQKWSAVGSTLAGSYKNNLPSNTQYELRKRTYNFDDATALINSIKSGQKIITEPGIKKSIDWKGKLYLAPLTTVGNLPFRRICKQFGADVTCGEMAMASNLLEGQQSEWALLRRHESEDIFGVQLCGAHPDLMTRASQLILDACSVDFIDINMGCPIDLVYRKGAGSGLMGRTSKLNSILDGMYQVSGDIAITIKMRMGIYEEKKIASKVIESIKESGGHRISLFTLHGRSREARYTRSADWDYIQECAAVANPIPLFGSGDILSYEDLDTFIKSDGNVSGAMIARGALIKPWIFTEIKERRHWDISAQERLEILKKFVNYGLEHWGSDNKGVETTRRFLLEWLSFLYRYIPIELLEVVPQKINERPPTFKGRNDLETLMISNSCSDWIKISEMLLGNVPQNFHFLPKHKANAYT